MDTSTHISIRLKRLLTISNDGRITRVCCLKQLKTRHLFCDMLSHPIRVVERGNYHVNVLTGCSGVQNPMISMLFIP